MEENPNGNAHTNSAAGLHQFPAAAQPEIMRAAEKDDYYMAHLSDACYSAFRHAFGTRLAVAYQSETKLAGRVLYYLLTTGAGLQTLGEEYCDIAQVSVTTSLPASPARRLLLVFYHTVLPYVTERLSSRAAARGMMLATLNEESTTQNSSSRYLQRESPTSNEVSNSQQAQALRMASSIQAPLIAETRFEHLQSISPSNTRRVILPSLRQRFQRTWVSALQRWSLILPFIKEAFVLLFRANLMLFYFDGFYYHVAKRAAGIRYILMSKPNQQRPRYHLLGIFLMIQLCIVGGDWIQRSIRQGIATSVHSRSSDSSFITAGSQGVAVLDEDGNVMHQKDHTKEHGVSSITAKGFADIEASPSKCPLCLSPRQNPAATSCGHVFCWTCIVEWCNEKPECPLCRSPLSHSDLVCVYHADF